MTPDGSRIVAGSFDGYIYYLNSQGKLLWKYKTKGWVGHISISQDGSRIVAGAEDGVYFLNSSGTLIWKYKTNSWVLSVAITSNGSRIVAGSYDRHNRAGRIYCFNSQGKLLWKYKTIDEVPSIAMTPDGSKIVAAGVSSIYVIFLAPALNLSTQVSGPTVTLDGSVQPGYSSASITKIHVNWGDGHEEDVKLPASHTYSKSRSYTITVTAYQSDGLTSVKVLKAEISSPTNFLVYLAISAALLILLLILVAVRRRGHHQ